MPKKPVSRHPKSLRLAVRSILLAGALAGGSSFPHTALGESIKRAIPAPNHDFPNPSPAKVELTKW